MSKPRLLCNVTTCINWIAGNTCTIENVYLTNLQYENAVTCICSNFKPRTPENLAERASRSKSLTAAIIRIMAEKPYQPEVWCDMGNCQFCSNNNSCNVNLLRIDGKKAVTVYDTFCDSYNFS